MLLRFLATAAGAIISVQLIRTIYRAVYLRFYSPVCYLSGPPNPSWVSGNFGRVTFAKTQEWQAKYGPTFMFRGFMSVPTLYTVDTVALHHIVNASDIYQKAPFVRYGMVQTLGRGLLALEDDEHTKLRKIMSPAFGPSQIKGLTQLFLDKALELSDVWAREPRDEAGWASIEVLSGLKAMTLDVIGLAGFNYQFHALNAEKAETELDGAFKALFLDSNAQRTTRVTQLLRARVPFLRRVMPGPKNLVAARRTMDRIGMQLLHDARDGVLSGEKEEGGGERRDILSLLVKSNMSEEIVESQRLNDDVVVAQLPTFFVAGHETTSTATTWALYALALHPHVQATLRAELLTMGTDSPSLDALNSLVYLDKVVREVMRVHSPVVMTNRMAMRDDVIPLGTPYTDTRGVRHDNIIVHKGQMFYVPIRAVNRDARIWGTDAAEFKPDRWDSVPDAASTIPGVWAHLFSFLGGPHNCIGWRFSLAEMKSLLYTLIRAYEFELAVSPEAIGTGATAVQRPMVLSEPEKGPQLPMRVRRVQV
ncbi:Cytochrome P450 [Mycena venus]|uniref:Cytochrome P450 n=1 Tax=Mycena venus TaxID=2733690 RepID=A0A8H6Y4W8_9AGAR|nr:Cytochrome P450 [Mycena venus]